MLRPFLQVLPRTTAIAWIDNCAIKGLDVIIIDASADHYLVQPVLKGCQGPPLHLSRHGTVHGQGNL
jgi:hypothetical protein